MDIKFKYLIVALLLSISSASVAGNMIVMATAGAEPPLHTEQLSGFTDIILKEAFNRIGYNLDIRVLPAERSLMMSNRGIIDGEVQRIAGMKDNYPNLIQVPENIIDWKFVVFSKQDINTKQGWNSLKPYVTSFITGWKIFEFNVPKEVTTSKVRHPEGMFRLLNQDRTDLILYELWQGLEHIKKHSYRDIKVSNPPLANRAMFPYLHKKHKHLVPKLAQSLKDMKNDGFYERIYQQVLAPLEQ